ncbi:MAG: 50S ribosomal protein L3 [Candidatus Woesearchaeota archaeon]|nr:MAG: 50S ribosomal protein L3 [Candidatus Woesearchaeota archaeon]
MPNVRRSRHGSLQFWPRAKAKRIYPRLRSKPQTKDTKLIGFLGYKVGMTHLTILDPNKNSLTKNQPIFCPVTILECPPLKAASVRFYKDTVYGLKAISQISSKNFDKELARIIDLPKKHKAQEPKLEDVAEVRLLVYTQPKLTGIGKKKPDLLELLISGGDIKSRVEYAKALLDKEIKISEVFKEGQLVDIHAVTKGKGFSGTVKKFGVDIRQHKSEKTKRGAGSLGPWTPKRVSFRAIQAGKFGYHTRTEYNKWFIKIGTNPKEVNPKGGFLHYGLIKNDYVILKGSVPGPAKRPVEITEPIRAPKSMQLLVPQIKYVSTESKQ